MFTLNCYICKSKLFLHSTSEVIELPGRSAPGRLSGYRKFFLLYTDRHTGVNRECLTCVSLLPCVHIQLSKIDCYPVSPG